MLKGLDLPRLTSYAEGSPAKTLVTLDHVGALRASARDFGRTCGESFARFAPASSSWRTSQRSLFAAWGEWSATWPGWGMTQSGIAYRLPPSVPRIFEHASLYWPTLVASEGKRGAKNRYSQGGMSLSCALGGCPNPPWTEWLMGFPIGWSD
jgi:hypothetical protein